MDYAVEVKNVSKCFRGAEALRHVSAGFEKGKIHGIVGQNGAGKTVLFKCICGLYPVSEGSITVLGQKIGNGKVVPKEVGAIIETPGFLPNCSGFLNLKYLMEVSGKAVPDKIREAIKAVGLDPDDRKHVGKYSLGMRQRLGIAQVLMDNPELIILDEPMNGLDKNGVKQIRTLLMQLREQGKTIIMASHNPDDIRILCDTLHEMDAGILTRIESI